MFGYEKLSEESIAQVHNVWGIEQITADSEVIKNSEAVSNEFASNDLTDVTA